MVKIKYADIMVNDIVDGEGICVSIWMGGCPHKCNGCHNPELWDFNSRKEILTKDLFPKIDEMLSANGIKRNFSILGGEPLCKENIDYTNHIGQYVRLYHPDIKIFLWTGYTIEELMEKGQPYNNCFDWADVIIDGPFELDKRDIRLRLRGSTNQRILKRGLDF